MATSSKKLQQPIHTARPTGAGISLKELAAHLGLSQTTISRVINRSPAATRIPECTQARVLQAASRLKYEANIFARGLRNKRSFTIGVLVPEISEGYSTMVLSGIEDALLKEGFFYFVVSHRHRPDLLEAYPQLLLARAVEGFIAIDTAMKTQLPVPVASVSGHIEHDGIVNIQVDHAKAVRFALEHLYELGHRKIAFIKGQVFSSDTRLRWRAICEESALLGIPVDPELTVQLEGFSGAGPGHEATNLLLKRNRKFTAIFAFNDLSAIGAIGALREAGVRVPEDVSVVGFDDILSASTNNPGLSTVRQPLYEMGNIAASTLLGTIRGQDWPKRSIRVLPTFIVRQSTGRVRS